MCIRVGKLDGKHTPHTHSQTPTREAHYELLKKIAPDFAPAKPPTPVTYDLPNP